MKRLDIRVYVDDDVAALHPDDMNTLAKQLSRAVTQSANLLCNDNCPDGFITVLTHIEDDADYMDDMYL